MKTFKLNLTARLFWVLASIVTAVVVIDSSFRYIETEKIVFERGYNRAKALNDYFVSMRFVYHQQFLKSGLDLNDSTVGFLPAHAASLISDEFAKRTTQGISIRNVSDNPRNKKNIADAEDIAQMNFFRANPDKNESIKVIMHNGQETLFYSTPLRVQAYCVACHGERENTLGYIKNRYDAAYGYKEGDVRGITSIRVPIDEVAAPMRKIFWESTLLMAGFLGLMLVLMYLAIKKLTKKQELLRAELEESVAKKTEELRGAYEQERHLRVILRTVADVNQLLITSKNMDELIQKSAQTLAANSSFSSVKILLRQPEGLIAKACYGEFEEAYASEVEKEVFESNRSTLIVDFDSSAVPAECRQKALDYGITAYYGMPLRKDSLGSDAIGVLSVCTKLSGGFSGEEMAMLDELAGDIGFAVNSFAQRDTIEKLNGEKFKSYEDFIEALVDMIEQRDTYTAGHTQRVAEYSLMIAKEMGIDDNEIKKLTDAAKLHDIGKVVTPDSVLLKPGKLTNLEFELIKEHVSAGYQVLSSIESYEELANIVITHHERFDGSGYPNGKRGDDIPLLGHILAVADSFDAMTTNRIYKARKSVRESLVELESLKGKLYHPAVIDAALKTLVGVTVDAGIDQALGKTELDRERLSYFFKDRLTKLYNEDYLTLVVNGRSIHKIPSAISVVSLVNFTKYNKDYSWGGNRLLISFAQYLLVTIPESLIFRVWGDKFIIMDSPLPVLEILANSPIPVAGVEYKIQTFTPPFESIEALLGWK